LTVLVAFYGTVVRATAPAERAGGLVAGAMLPRQLRTWLSGERRTRELVVDGRRLRVRLLAGAYPGLDALQLTPVGRPPDVDALLALGLTRRQAEILGCAMRGWSSKQIAVELGLSRRTIEKHFEGIYARLGVGNRAEAIVRALSDGATLHSWSQDAQANW
jgi:DNA-binding CsgD family transcriptional regulator